MAKFKTGDAVKVTDFVGKVFKGEVRSADQDLVNILVPEGHTTEGARGPEPEPYLWSFFPPELAQEPFGDYGLRIEPWTETEQPTTPFTLLDDEGRKALKAGDRVLVEVRVAGAANEDGEIPYSGTHELDTWTTFAAPKDFFALLPPAKKPIAVGDFVNILGRAGSKGKVLAFMSNGHAVVEYVAGDDFNVSHYDLSCLKVIS